MPHLPYTSIWKSKKKKNHNILSVQNKCTQFVTFLFTRCMELEEIGSCQCDPAQRMLRGTWTCAELRKSLDLGYSLEKIHEVYSYEQTSKYDKENGIHSVFSEFINFWLQIKQESSGLPQWVMVAEDPELAKQKYIDLYFHQEGIRLRPEKIQKNPGLRSISKLLLNSFWYYVTLYNHKNIKKYHTPSQTMNTPLHKPFYFYNIL